MTDIRPKGVDLSHFNVAPTFHQIVGSGVSFVYLKATQGDCYVDPTYSDRRTRASSVGLRVGSYHFFDPRMGGKAQAEHFVSVVQALGDGELPPALDLESTEGWDALSLDQRVQEVSDWLSLVERELGVRPMIYTSVGWWRGEFGDSDFSGHPLWLAHYAPTPGDTGLWSTWTCWQYGQYGSVLGAGVGCVDTDVWNGPLPELASATRCEAAA